MAEPAGKVLRFCKDTRTPNRVCPMLTITNTLLPLIILLLAGYGMHRTGFLADGFWIPAERLTYYVLMPVLLVRVIGPAELGDVTVFPAVITVLSGVCAMALGLWFAGRGLRRRLGGPKYTSVLQGVVRFNTYIALAVAQGLYGAEGVLIGGLMAGFMIPTVNVLCVATFSVVNGERGVQPRRLLKDLAVNPLLLGCVFGGVLNVADAAFPVWVLNSLDLTAGMALPLALLASGAALRFSRLRDDLSPALLAVTGQFAVKPLIAYAVGVSLSLDQMHLVLAVVFMGVPTASSSSILARKMGGDHTTMATIIAVQTVLAFATLPVTMALLGVT